MAIASLPIVLLALYVYAKRSDLMRPIDLLGIAAIVIFLFLPPRLRTWGAVALAFVELFVFNAGFNALVDAKYFRPTVPMIEALRAHASREPFRVAGLLWTLLPNASAQYGLEDVRGSDPMALAAYDRFLQRLTTGSGAGPWVRLIADANKPELAFLNVRFLLAAPDAPSPGGVWRLIYHGADGTLWENPAALPRFFARGAEIRNLRSTSPGEFVMVVSTPSPVLVESSEPLAPGRRVYVGTRRAPLRHVADSFIGFEVPAGTWQVRVVYRPVSFYVSSAISLMTMVALVLWPTRRVAAGPAARRIGHGSF